MGLSKEDKYLAANLGLALISGGFEQSNRQYNQTYRELSADNTAGMQYLRDELTLGENALATVLAKKDSQLKEIREKTGMIYNLDPTFRSGSALDDVVGSTQDDIMKARSADLENIQGNISQTLNQLEELGVQQFHLNKVDAYFQGGADWSGGVDPNWYDPKDFTWDGFKNWLSSSEGTSFNEDAQGNILDDPLTPENEQLLYSYVKGEYDRLGLEGRKKSWEVNQNLAAARGFKADALKKEAQTLEVLQGQRYDNYDRLKILEDEYKQSIDSYVSEDINRSAAGGLIGTLTDDLSVRTQVLQAYNDARASGIEEEEARANWINAQEDFKKISKLSAVFFANKYNVSANEFYATEKQVDYLAKLISDFQGNPNWNEMDSREWFSRELNQTQTLGYDYLDEYGALMESRILLDESLISGELFGVPYDITTPEGQQSIQDLSKKIKVDWQAGSDVVNLMIQGYLESQDTKNPTGLSFADGMAKAYGLYLRNTNPETGEKGYFTDGQWSTIQSAFNINKQKFLERAKYFGELSNQFDNIQSQKMLELGKIRDFEIDFEGDPAKYQQFMLKQDDEVADVGESKVSFSQYGDIEMFPEPRLDPISEFNPSFQYGDVNLEEGLELDQSVNDLIASKSQDFMSKVLDRIPSYEAGLKVGDAGFNAQARNILTAAEFFIEDEVEDTTIVPNVAITPNEEDGDIEEERDFVNISATSSENINTFGKEAIRDSLSVTLEPRIASAYEDTANYIFDNIDDLVFNMDRGDEIMYDSQVEEMQLIYNEIAPNEGWPEITDADGKFGKETYQAYIRAWQAGEDIMDAINMDEDDLGYKEPTDTPERNIESEVLNTHVEMDTSYEYLAEFDIVNQSVNSSYDILTRGDSVQAQINKEQIEPSLLQGGWMTISRYDPISVPSYPEFRESVEKYRDVDSWWDWDPLRGAIESFTPKNDNILFAQLDDDEREARIDTIYDSFVHSWISVHGTSPMSRKEWDKKFSKYTFVEYGRAIQYLGIPLSSEMLEELGRNLR